MSRTFYFDLNPQKVNFSLNYLQNMIQKKLRPYHTVKLSLFKEEFGGRFYIDKESSKGVEVFLFERKQFVMKLNVLSNEADYLLCKKMLTVLVKQFNLEIQEEDDDELILETESAIEELFLPKKILRERVIETDVILTLITRNKSNIRFDGINNPVYFGMDFINEVEKKKLKDEQIIKKIDQTMHKIQWELPDYCKPAPAIISANDSGKKFKVRIMLCDRDYILTDYEYLLISDSESADEVIYINHDDLKKIIHDLHLFWQKADEFTVVAPKLSQPEWKAFVSVARKLNRKKEIDKPTKFSFKVKDVFKLNKVDILVGKGSLPFYEGKVHCSEIELEISPAWGNSQENIDNLSFQVKRGKAERSLIGKIFTN
ncbi:hypothetical protein [Treponema sp.]|uniref:hypothetical protein n=1 Tax=Treponema sp. TaxID=166 RepID=UPI00257A32E0|nr:hypothetical protein [Treponema sp.]MBE6355250.1 hypothetical protein [Treponema sp.]